MARVQQGWKLLPLVAAGGVALAAFGMVGRSEPAAAQVKREHLRPGVVATYRGGGNNPVELAQLEPALALTLKAGESPHPRLAADGGSIHYSGYLNILRGGSYPFSEL